MEQPEDWGGAGRDPVAEGLALIGRGLDLVMGARGWSMTDEQSLEAVKHLGRLRQRGEGAHLHLLRIVEDKDAARATGAPDTARWLSSALRIAPGRAKADVVNAHLTTPGTGPLAAIGADLASGEVTVGHVDVARRTLDRIPAHLLRADRAAADEAADAAEPSDAAADDGPVGPRVQAFLAEHSRRYTPGQVDQLARHLLAVLDPDGTDSFDPDSHTRRQWNATTDGTGMYVGRFALDPVTGAHVKAFLDHHARPLPATASSGGPADAERLPVRDGRTAGQRNADAVGLMARLALAATESTRAGEPPVVMVHATPEQLDAAQAGGPGGGGAGGGGPGGGGPGGGGTDPAAPGLATCDQTGPLPAWALRRLACDAKFQLVLRSADGAVLHLGRTRRFASTAQRRALVARDHGCAFPGCRAPAAWCDAHHVTPWRDGGPTDIDQLVLLCPAHHTIADLGTWAITVRDGVPWFTPPAWVDPEQRALRNTWTDDVDQAHRLGQRLRRRAGRDHDHDRADPGLPGLPGPPTDRPPPGHPPRQE